MAVVGKARPGARTLQRDRDRIASWTSGYARQALGTDFVAALVAGVIAFGIRFRYPSFGNPWSTPYIGLSLILPFLWISVLGMARAYERQLFGVGSEEFHRVIQAGFSLTATVAILAYAAKYATALYGPFREAVDVEIAGGGDRKAYQQDPANVRESLEEVRLDVQEGADLLMVKPALGYLDVLSDVAAISDVPVWAYQVSGEYAMVEAAAANGWIDRNRIIEETLIGARRAGADAVLTYWATEVAGWLR